MSQSELDICVSDKKYLPAILGAEIEEMLQKAEILVTIQIFPKNIEINL